MTTRRVAIIGGGLAGLTAAHRLTGAAEVLLFEQSARLGGQILTEQAHGFTIERGAEGFVFRSTAVPALVGALGLPDESLIGQSTLRSYGFDGRALQALAPGEAATYLGFQVSREDLGKGIRSLRRGMGSLTAALEHALERAAGVTLRRETRVVALEHTRDAMTVVTADGARHAGHAVLLATTAAAAAPLFASVLPATPEAAALAQSPTLSSVTVELAFGRDAVRHALDGTGFVVAQAAQHDGLRACTFTSAKFADRAPAGQTSLRLFFRPTAEDLQALDDAAWIDRAVRGLGRVLDVRGELLHAWVSRWPNALPVFSDEHKATVAAVERALQAAALPLLLAGSAFAGSGIDAAVQSGERAAENLRALLTGHTV